MKKLIFVCQGKGGAGKSIATFLLAEVLTEATIFDMDEEMKTTSMQLKYRNPKVIKFLNDNNTIDRGYFDGFLEMITELTKKKTFICDLGASISGQLPFYLGDASEDIADFLRESKIELELHVVVNGYNNFSATMNYLDQLKQAVKGAFKIIVLKNEYFRFSDNQNNALKEYANLSNLEVIPFNIADDNNLATQNRIMEVLQSGEGSSKAPALTKRYFTKAIARLEQCLNESTAATTEE